ncbi:MAG TPA: hypothetical protein VI300_04740 [Solirubrobacter sp.]
MDTRSDRFIVLSARLTGFGRVTLLGTGMTAEYLAALDAVVGVELTDELLATEDVATLVEDPKLGPVAKNLILLWYCGTWTALPEDWRATYGASPLDTTRVESAEAYQAGLQWVVAGAHPAGARQQGFGAWSIAPEGVTG